MQLSITRQNRGHADDGTISFAVSPISWAEVRILALMASTVPFSPRISSLWRTVLASGMHIQRIP